MIHCPPFLAAYRYGLVSPETPPRPGAFGIEVTDPSLARMCTDGSLDPQHGAGSTACALAAIEAAARIELPRLGSTLVTIRPDCDAIGAMALLAWRSSGLGVDSNMQERIARIGAMDRHDRGPWPGPRPLPRSEADSREDWPGEELAALAVAVSDKTLPVFARVQLAARWLAFGEVPQDARAAITARRGSQIEALESGRITVRRIGAKVAAIQTSDPGALAIAYCLAPFVVATNPNYCFGSGLRGVKHTVAHWEGHGLSTFKERMSALEPGWGGSPGIVGSPQFKASQLDADAVANLLSETL